MAAVTLVAWFVAGVVVAALIARQQKGATTIAGFARAVPHVLLWPLFVPVLLPQAPQPAMHRQPTAYDPRIRDAESRLAEALNGLARDLGDPLLIERTRATGLAKAMRSAAARVGALEQVMIAPEHDLARLRQELQQAEDNPESAALTEALRRRLAHVERIGAIHRQTKGELERALAESAALASRLTLLRYEGLDNGTAAAARARELTDSVEELCRVLAEARAA